MRTLAATPFTRLTTAVGVQLGHGVYNSDIRFPLTISQCEPVLIYYNLSRGGGRSDRINISMRGVGDQAFREERYFINFLIPSGIGYLEWICNIPAGYGFIAKSYFEHYFVVQPGPSSSCLHNVTTTYSIAYYSTTEFEAYTRNPPSASPTEYSQNLAKSTAFPTASYSTITANPEFAPTFPTIRSITTSSASLRPSSTPSSASRTSSKTAALVGGIIGGAILILTCIFVSVRLWNHSSQRQAVDQTGPIEPWVPTTDQSTPSMTTTGFSEYNGTPTRPASRHKPTILSHDAQPTIPIRESMDPGSNLAEALDAVSCLRPNADQRDILVTALNASTTPSVSLHTVPQVQPTSVAPQDSPSHATRLMAALNSFSRLTPEEKRTVVSMLSNLDASGGLQLHVHHPHIVTNCSQLL